MTGTAVPHQQHLSLMPSPSIQLARSLGPLVTVDALQNMTAYDLFVKQLESGSTEASMDAMKRLSVVAKTMGAEQARTVLVPYLTALAQQQPPPVDELLLVLGQELPAVCRLVGSAAAGNSAAGGNTEEIFLPMLERLAAVEETVVREQAVVVIVELAKTAGGVMSQTSGGSSSSSSASTTTDAAFASADGTSSSAATTPAAACSASAPVWMAMIKRLAAADWFTPKVSAAGIIASLFYLVPPTDYIELLNLYKELCVDETPMVRRAAAKHLGSVLAVNSNSSSSSSSTGSSSSSGSSNMMHQRNAAHQQQHRDFCLHVLPRLAADEQDSVRRLAVAAIGEAGTSYGENTAWTAQHWLSLVKDGATDMSWYVYKYSFASASRKKKYYRHASSSFFFLLPVAFVLERYSRIYPHGAILYAFCQYFFLSSHSIITMLKTKYNTKNKQARSTQSLQELFQCRHESRHSK
jgi:serine/threonine-protein phosphatase 2A regulatory subunit A